MDVEPHNISYSDGQPETFRAQLLAVLQVEKSRPEIASITHSSLTPPTSTCYIYIRWLL